MPLKPEKGKGWQDANHTRKIGNTTKTIQQTFKIRIQKEANMPKYNGVGSCCTRNSCHINLYCLAFPNTLQTSFEVLNGVCLQIKICLGPKCHSGLNFIYQLFHIQFNPMEFFGSRICEL